MDNKTFFEFYDLKELTIRAINGDGSSLKMLIEMPVYMEYVANGFRCDFDLDYSHEFIFECTEKINMSGDITVNEYYLDGDKLIITVNDKKMVIPDKGITIHKLKDNL